MHPWLATLLLCAGFFAVALVIRLYRLDGQSLWLDEGSSWELSRQPWGFLVAELWNPNAAYPLYHLLLKGWMGLFGDSEAALRMPSALAGALTVPVVYLAATELERQGQPSTTDRRPSAYGLAAALYLLTAPFAIWYSQEAKVYSLLLLSSALFAWALARAIRTMTMRDLAVAAGIGLVGLFVHRLTALLLVAGVWAVYVRLLTTAGGQPPAPGGGRERAVNRKEARGRLLPPLLLILPLCLSLALVWALVGGIGGEQAAGRSAAGAALPAGPGLALGLSFVRFSVDRWPGDAPWWWLVPWVALALWGFVQALLDLRRAEVRSRALFLLLLFGAPLTLFVTQLAWTKLYEARYLIVVYPIWALLLGYPLARRDDRRPVSADRQAPAGTQVMYWALLAGALLTGGLALFQPTFGLFSGDPVKEQYREAIGELAVRLHPDDAVVLHPAYLRPLYAYYMGRFSTDPPPEPLVFFNFWQGETSYGQREWDIERREKLAGYTRSFLLIAPDHARTVDRPSEGTGDEYGLVGNFWRFSREQATWPCGIWRYNGAHLLCQEAPEAYYTGEVPTPETPVGAVFGDNLTLLGYTLKATTLPGPGVYRAGGSVPISLFWDVQTPPSVDFSLFLHLCRECELRPAAGEDGPPLEGYLPTSSWLPGKPARDDRAIALPRDLPPGRYALLLGLYDPADPSEGGRLTVTGGKMAGDDRLILATIEIVPADAVLVAEDAGNP